MWIKKSRVPYCCNSFQQLFIKNISTKEKKGLFFCTCSAFLNHICFYDKQSQVSQNQPGLKIELSFTADATDLNFGHNAQFIFIIAD